MMQLYKMTLKLFCQTRSVIIPYILLLALDNIVLFRLLHAFIGSDNTYVTPIFFMKDIALICFLTFVFFIFISYEFMRKIREASLEEILFVAGTRGSSIYGLQMLVLWTVAAVQALNVSVYLITGYYVLDMSSQYISEIVLFALVDFLFLSLAAIGIGFALSWMKRRIWGYGAVIFIVFLTLPNTARILLDWQENLHIPIFTLRDFIYLIQPDLAAFPDPLYGLPLEWYRQAAMLFWVFFSVLLCSWIILRSKRGLRCAVSIILAGCMIVMGFGVVDKGSVLLMVDHPESSLEEKSEYNRNNPAREEEADFSVSAYDIELSVGKEMAAEVAIAIQQDKVLSEYPFTLYHGYEVTKITDGRGNELPFRQEDDYIWVDNGNLSRIEMLNFSYRGSSPTFYANSKACFLPGCFPYYPKAGCHTIYEGYVFTGAGSATADYQVRVSGLRSPLFSNLEEKDGVLSGRTDNVLLVSGYCDQIDINGVPCLYYPAQKTCVENAERLLSKEMTEEMAQLCQFLGAETNPVADGKMLVTIPDSLSFNSVLDTYYEFDDYILFNGWLEPYDILKAHTGTEGKEEIGKLFFDIRPDADLDLDLYNSTLFKNMVEPDEYDESMELSDTFIIKMRELGVQYVAQKTYQYLTDPQDQTDALDFLKQL